MTVMTATEASRRFSALLDRVEAGETIEITRDGKAICAVSPIKPHTWGALMEAIKDFPPDPEGAALAQESYEYCRSLTQEDLWDNV